MGRGVRLARHVGIAIGSLVAAYLSVSLVLGTFLGGTGMDSPVVAAIIVVFGGLVFADITRRERRDGRMEHLPSV
jgi:hypothetical protein